MLCIQERKENDADDWADTFRKRQSSLTNDSPQIEHVWYVNVVMC